MITMTYGEIADGLKTTRDFFNFVGALTPMREAVLGLRLRKLLRIEREADKQRALIETLTKALEAAHACLEDEPEYHYSGMGCGLEDRNIHDRYDAMQHGWDCAMERVYGEPINGAREVITAALAAAKEISA